MRVPEPRRIRLSRDTVLSEHPYLYCEHDAANRVDPSGHQDDDLMRAGNDIMATATGAAFVCWIIPEPLVSKAFGVGLVTILGGAGAIVYAVGRLTPSSPMHDLPPPTSNEWRRYRKYIVDQWSEGRNRPPGGSTINPGPPSGARPLTEIPLV